MMDRIETSNNLLTSGFLQTLTFGYISLKLILQMQQ